MTHFHKNAGQVTPGLDALHALCDAQSGVVVETIDISDAGIDAQWAKAAKQFADAIAAKPFDTLSFIMAYEGGELEFEEMVTGFQHLINSGQVWSLQGSYGRMAARLIEDGECNAV